MALVQSLITQDKYGIKCPYSMQPKGICVHNTANDASAKNEISYMKSNNMEVSFHVAIDDVEAIQGIPFNRNAYHAGDGKNGNGNRKTISIEICYSKSGGEKFDNAEKNAAHYIATLLKENNWTTKDVYTHQHWSGKNCPHRTMANGWERFLNMIQVELDKLNGKNTSPVPTPITTTIRSYLMKGDKGADVKQLQNDLNYLGYSCGTADGIFGTKTDTALRKFQSAYKLTVDGKYGNASKSQMSKAISMKKASTSVPSSTYTRTQFIKDVQKAIGVTVDGIVGNKTLSALVTVSKSKNSKHAVVKPLQKYLNALGYNCGTVDGIAGSKFDSAAKAWQKANGCVADGEFTKGGKSYRKILGVA